MSMLIKVASALWIVLVVVGPGAHASTHPSLNTQQLDRYVMRMMDAYDVPGVGLAVVEDGEITYVRGYGVRDVTTRSPVTPDTQFATGSVTKSFTALGVMLLVEEGLIDLDAPVVRYLPEFRLTEPAATRGVTVRHLLTHTSGLARDEASSFDLQITRPEIVTLAATTPLIGRPGERFEYSNVNTVIAGVIIERLTGESWEAFTRERILEPLGMTAASLSIPELKQQRDFAFPHELDVLHGVRTTEFLTTRADAPAGALNSSAAEMAHYVRFQLGGGAPLVFRESIDKMHRGQIAAPDANLPGDVYAQAREVVAHPERIPPPLVTDAEYGFYWAVERFLGERVVQHGGNSIGFTANVTLLPEHRAGVVILTNADRADYFVETLRLHVAELLLGRPAPTFTRSCKRSSRFWAKTTRAASATSRPPAPTGLHRENSQGSPPRTEASAAPNRRGSRLSGSGRSGSSPASKGSASQSNCCRSVGAAFSATASRSSATS
jgi:CubicO group peptidase (beta-lactamase class C family)